MEKNHQVEMMSDIYGRAGRVCIWLGEGDDSSRLALKFSILLIYYPVPPVPDCWAIYYALINSASLKSNTDSKIS